MRLWIDDLREAPEEYFWCKSVNEAKCWIEAGCQYIAYSVDYGIFVDACRILNKNLKAL